MLNKLKTLGQEPLVIPKVWRFSASQLTTFSKCPRKWGFKYLLGYDDPPGPAAELGKKLHKQLEDYFNEGKDVEHVAAKASLEHLPANDGSRVLEIETELRMLLEDGDSFLGYVDMLDVTDPTEPEVIDHKTTSNLKYAKTEYELQTDIQMMAYATWTFLRYPKAKQVRLTHNVVPTRGGKPKRTSILVDKEHVKEQWARLMTVIKRAKTFVGEDDIRKVPDDGRRNGGCEMYGGCPYNGMCTAATMFGQRSRRRKTK